MGLSYNCPSGGVIAGGTYYVSWAPVAGEIKNISYAKGAHPSGGKAVLEEISPAYQLWNPNRPALGPWGGVAPSQTFTWASINAYAGACFAPSLRKLIGYGEGHAAVCVPVPWSYDLETRSYEWLAAPVPSDGFTLLNGAAANAATVAAAYPAAQFDTTWGDWQGDYSGWPAGYSQPGKIFPETGHSYHALVFIPGESYGNTNGAMLTVGAVTGATTGSDMRRAHLFDLDTNTWRRCANRPSADGSAAGGACHDPVTNKVYFLGHSGSTASQATIDVLDVSTLTWTVKTAAAGIPMVIHSGGLRVFEPGGLILYFAPELADNTPAYYGVRHRMYAAKAADILAGNWTWTLIRPTATSWPLRSDGTITTIGWSYCPPSGCFYAVNGVNGSQSLWKLSPPAGATTAAQYLAGAWTISTGPLSGALVSKTANGATGDSFVYSRLQWDWKSRSFLWFSDYIEAPVQSVRPLGVL